MNIDRINSELKRQIAMIIDAGEIHNPKLKGMISVTSVETAKDLGSARVFVSVFGADIKEVLAALKTSAGYIANILKKRVRIRTIPEIRFEIDNSIEYGLKMDQLIEKAISGDSKDDN